MHVQLAQMWLDERSESLLATGAHQLIFALVK